MSPIKILLIDDDEDDFVLTKDLLAVAPYNTKYEVYWSDNYSDGINAILKDLYDIYLVDFRLGKFSGIDLLHEAVKSNSTRPVIILTGKGDNNVDYEAMSHGAADYLVKDQITTLSLDRSIRYALAHYKNHQQLKDSEKKFRIIFEKSKNPMLITDYEGNMYDANTAAVEFLESSREVLLAKNSAALYKDKHSRKIFTEIMQAQGAVNNLEVELVTLTGKLKYCSISSFLQISQNGNEERYYSIIHDLSNRILKEKQLVLQEKLSAIERIAKNLASEIYDPLSNVNFALDELEVSCNDQDGLTLIDIIKKNCDRINDLTSQFIESTKSTPLRIKKTDLNELLLSSVREAESLYNLEIITIVSKKPIWLNLDEQALHTVWLNVFQNAADAMNNETGQILVEVKRGIKTVSVKITDSGEGIPQENLNNVFEPFFSTKSRSSGLGLTYSQRIIQAHDGTIEISSKHKKGTTVKITLPV